MGTTVVGLWSCGMQAYSLLRSASGLLQFAKEKCSPPLANICLSLDCNSQVRYDLFPEPPKSDLFLEVIQTAPSAEAWSPIC